MWGLNLENPLNCECRNKESQGVVAHCGVVVENLQKPGWVGLQPAHWSINWEVAGGVSKVSGGSFATTTAATGCQPAKAASGCQGGCCNSFCKWLPPVVHCCCLDDTSNYPWHPSPTCPKNKTKFSPFWSLLNGRENSVRLVMGSLRLTHTVSSCGVFIWANPFSSRILVMRFKVVTMICNVFISLCVAFCCFLFFRVLQSLD